MKVPFKIIPERSLHLDREFTEQDADLLISRLFALNRNEGKIFLQINSSGGSFTGTQKIYDNIVMSPNPVIGLVVGDCFSGASLVLQACSTRYASKHARLLIHHVFYPVKIILHHYDTVEKLAPMILEEINTIKKNNQILVNILEKKLKISANQIIEIMDKEEPMNPEQALAIGLIDEIL